MDGGMSTAVELVGMSKARRALELTAVVNVETVRPLVEALGEAEEHELIEIHIRHNAGGEVDTLFVLIHAIVHTKAQVEITIGRYLMSAAATLWLWFWLWPVPHVRSLMPLKPAVLMYHRPRQQCASNGDYYCFAESMKDTDPVKQSLMGKIQVFDNLFDALLRRLGWSSLSSAELLLEDVPYQHQLQHMKEAYYGNKDVVLPVFPDQGATDEDVRTEQ